MKTKKIILSIMMVIALMLSAIVPCFAEGESDVITKINATFVAPTGNVRDSIEDGKYLLSGVTLSNLSTSVNLSEVGTITSTKLTYYDLVAKAYNEVNTANLEEGKLYSTAFTINITASSPYTFGETVTSAITGTGWKVEKVNDKQIILRSPSFSPIRPSYKLFFDQPENATLSIIYGGKNIKSGDEIIADACFTVVIKPKNGYGVTSTLLNDKEMAGYFLMPWQNALLKIETGVRTSLVSIKGKVNSPTVYVGDDPNTIKAEIEEFYFVDAGGNEIPLTDIATVEWSKIYYKVFDTNVIAPLTEDTLYQNKVKIVLTEEAKKTYSIDVPLAIDIDGWFLLSGYTYYDNITITSDDFQAVPKEAGKVNVDTSENGDIEINCGEAAKEGTEVTIKALPKEGYEFDHWEVTGLTLAKEATEAENSFVMPSGDVQIKAVYKEKTTEPDPTEPQPTEVDPTEPQPTEVDPTEPQPTEVDPTEPQPTEVDPTEPQPTKPDDDNPTDVKPTEENPEEPEKKKNPTAVIIVVVAVAVLVGVAGVYASIKRKR